MRSLLDTWFKLSPGDAAFYAVFGLVFVVAGIALLVGILMLIGFIMKKVTARKAEGSPQPPVPKLAPPEEESGDGLSEETIAAITAAIAVCLEGEQAHCDFVVRRIKRL